MCDFRNKFQLPKRHTPSELKIWDIYYNLFMKYKPIDLGQGFPNFLPPKFVRDAFQQVAHSSNNAIFQYTRGAGHPRFVTVVAQFCSKLLKREIDPYNEVIATLGGYHALYLAFMGLIEEGDEVIIIEPFFECYEENVRTAGGVPRFIQLKPTTWELDFVELAALFNEKTKAIVVNTPHNPLGKVFTFEELSQIAELCKKWNVICIADEVYQFLVYDEKKHISIASLPQMWERTVTVSSVGKLFSSTGFKLGWALGPDYLIKNLKKIHFESVRAGNTILQEVAAICLESELARLDSDESYLRSLPKTIELKRNFLYDVLKEKGFEPLKPEGGYFMVADWSKIKSRIDWSCHVDENEDFCFTKWMIENVGVQALPISAFYTKEHQRDGERFIRFCFFKSEESLTKSVEAFRKWKL